MDMEPNDTFGTAQVIGAAAFTTDFDANIFDSTTIPHATVMGTGNGTHDFFRFFSDGSFTITADVDAPTNFDTQMFLFDAAGNFVAGSDDNGGDPGDGGGIIGGAFNSRFSFNGPAGDYIVGIGAFPLGASAGGVLTGPGVPNGGVYTLHISAGIPAPIPEPATLTLLGLGLGGLAAGAARRRKARG
jgi:hypothetical protein